MSDRNNIQWGNIGAASMLFGILFLVIGGWNLFQAVQVSSWSTVPGEIVESKVDQVGRSGPDQPDVRYRFEVNGKPYTGSRIGYMLLVSDQEARHLVEQYPVGAHVEVRYDKNDPTRSVLRAGGASMAIIFIFAGAMLLALRSYASRRARRTSV